MKNKKLYSFKLKKVKVQLGENVPMKLIAISKAATLSHLIVFLNEKLKAYNALVSLLDKEEKFLQDKSNPIYDAIDEIYECFQDNHNNIQ